MLVTVADFLAFLHRSIEEKIGNVEEIIVPARAPDQENGSLLLRSIKETTEFTLDGYRAVDPVKILFYLFREQVLGKDYSTRNRIIAGVKACDLKALAILDKALITHEFADPSYKHWREHTIIISSDCTSLGKSCHCNLLAGKPYPESGYDLNLSRLENQYFIRVGSEKGQQLLDLMKKHISFQEARADLISEVNNNRVALLKELEKQNKNFEHPTDYKNLRMSATDSWNLESKECIGCGACTNICPTCYCLILNDESEAHKFVKVRTYDSCQLYGYARVAGGATPRPKMYQRFRNRYLCKFDYMKSNFGELGCTGCGRCIDTCPASIDFREVVHNIGQKPIHEISSKKRIETQAIGEV